MGTHPKSRSQTLREKERRMMAKGSKRHSGKSAGKATKLMGFGFHAEKRARSNSNETRGGLGRSKGKRGVSPIEIRQSQSSKVSGSDADWWLPPGVQLPVADEDKRYQEALSQHDIRFCTIKSVGGGDGKEPARITKTLPSDKLDQQLRLVMNSMAAFSLTGTPTAQASPNGKRSSTKRSSYKGKQKKKFSIFGK